MTYYATTIALATSAHSLLDYINGTQAGAGHTSTAFTVAAQVDFTPASGNSGNVVIGDSSVTTADAGKVLTSTSPAFTLRKSPSTNSPATRINLADIYLLGSAASQSVNVSILL